MSESNFINLLRQGDQATFRKLVEEFSPRVYRVALGILRNEEDATDISQEVFAEVFISIQKFKEGSLLSTWIYRITVTKSLEHLRYKNRKKRSGNVFSIFGFGESGYSVEIPDYHHPGVSLENQERAAILFKAIDSLPEKQKTAYTLHKVEDFSHQEIADIMETTISAVESLIVRARQNLKKYLSDYYDTI